MGELSVNAMRGKLFGTRMLFNMMSMMTDTAKIHQASVLSSWAGPFAPLVSILLLVCWVVAETVLDVMILMGDGGKLDDSNGEIPLFKQSEDWLFSLEGAAGKVANMAINKIVEGVKKEANELIRRYRSKEDDRVVNVELTSKGEELQDKAKDVPGKMLCKMYLEEDKVVDLKKELDNVLNQLK